MKLSNIITLIALILLPLTALAQDVPTFQPTVIWTLGDGTTLDDQSIQESAPITGAFRANPENDEGWTALYEWRFTKEGTTEPYLIRYDENTEVTFTEFGKTKVCCYVKFINGTDTVAYDQEYWDENIGDMSVSVKESKLEMPNAFSPNGDEFNEIYKPKKNYQSIVEFHAVIYNRYGQKLFEWDDPSTGWDGTYNGHPVKEGVYYCQVKAKGADGVKYNIKRDVNLLRGFTEEVKNEE